MAFIYSAQGKVYTDNSKSCKNINSSISQNYNDIKNITCNTCYNKRIIDNFETTVEVYNSYTDTDDIKILKNIINKYDKNILDILVKKLQNREPYMQIIIFLEDVKKKNLNNIEFIDLLISLFKKSYINKININEISTMFQIINDIVRFLLPIINRLDQSSIKIPSKVLTNQPNMNSIDSIMSEINSSSSDALTKSEINDIIKKYNR